MLKIVIPSTEAFDDEKQEFFQTKGTVLTLEHSLVSLSKWESTWCKPFLTKEPKTQIEELDYIRCMTITQNVDPNIYKFIDDEVKEQINNYINYPMTATTFSKSKNVFSREIITAEIIYYWMVTFNIPSEYQKWHLNRLLTLINVCNIKNQPKKKMPRKQLNARNRALNEARRQQLGTKG